MPFWKVLPPVCTSVPAISSEFCPLWESFYWSVFLLTIFLTKPWLKHQWKDFVTLKWKTGLICVLPGGSWDHAGFYHFLCYLIQFWVFNLSEFALETVSRLSLNGFKKNLENGLLPITYCVKTSINHSSSPSFVILQDWNILSWVFYHQLLTWSALETPLTKEPLRGHDLERSENRWCTMERSLPQFLSQRVCLSFILITDRK